MNQTVSRKTVDCSNQRLATWEEIDLAIYAVLTVAFGEQRASDRVAIQAMLPEEPTAVEVVDAVFSFRRRVGKIENERNLRAHAGTVMALFLMLGNWVRKLSPPAGKAASAIKALGSARQSLPLAEA